MFTPTAFYDPRTDGWFGRVNLSQDGKHVLHRVVRICRPCKDEALKDAAYVADVARRTGKIDCGVVYHA